MAAITIMGHKAYSVFIAPGMGLRWNDAHGNAVDEHCCDQETEPVVSISIRDNGCGFNANGKSSSEPHALGYGLSGIAERVRILGGTLMIDSRPGVGTSLTVEVPLCICECDTGSDGIDRG